MGEFEDFMNLFDFDENESDEEKIEFTLKFDKDGFLAFMNILGYGSFKLTQKDDFWLSMGGVAVLNDVINQLPMELIHLYTEYLNS